MTTATFNRDSLARWYAEQHLETDPGITKVVYLPGNSSEREIRFLEINKLLEGDHSNQQLVPIDFGVDTGQETAHRLYVVDLTPKQWDAVRSEQLALPAGWSLDSRVEYPSE